MAMIKLKFVNSFYGRAGRIRHLVRVPGQKAKTLPGVPGSEPFMAAYHAALAMGDVNNDPSLGASRSKAGSFDALIKAYYKSKVFTLGFAPETQRVRRAALEGWRADHGDKRVAHLQPNHVRNFLEQKKPHAQKNWLKALRGLMLFAIAQNYRADDPTKDVRPVRPPKSAGFMTWGHSEIEAYRNTHALGSVARLALELMLNIAARRGDAYQLGPQHLKDGKLCWRPNKTKRSTGKALSIRILPELQAALDAMPSTHSMTFLVTDYGRPFASAVAFGNKFAEWCRQAGLKPVQCDDGRVGNYRAHGLRKAACKALAHAGCTAPQIMAISGHSNLAQVQIYIAEVEQERMAEDAMNTLTAARK
jgi:integrase